MIDRKHSKKIAPFAKELCKNMTKEERHLWYDFLKNYPVRFKRQKVLGKYIADFYCAKANLVVELDGSQHFEEKGLAKDEERTMYLQQYGILVIRITNLEIVQNFDGVCMYIDNLVKERLAEGEENNPSVSHADRSPYTGEPFGANDEDIPYSTR